MRHMKQSQCQCGCGQEFNALAPYPSGRSRHVPQRFIHGHNAKQLDTKTRFWSKVDIRSKHECWEWKASLRSTGYGQFELGRTMLKSHRVAYELTHGTIHNGLHVCHTCDNRKCVNPSHLFLGTNADNANDRTLKRRSAVGKQLPQTKLNKTSVKHIKRMLLKGISKIQIAKQYRVSPATIHAIANGDTWKYV